MKVFTRFWFLIVFFKIGFASLPDADEQENREYARGIIFRDHAQELLKSPAGKERAFAYLNDAISIFKPLAENNIARSGFAKAQHNLAYCYFLTSDFTASLKFFRLAREQGLEVSARNLSKFPFVLALPDELLTHTATFLDIKSLLNLMQVSKRLYRDCHMALSLMDFLTADGKVLLPGFESAVFNPVPKSIQVRRQIKSKGNVELRFSSAEHLQDIGRKYPCVRSKNTYFVFCPAATSDDEIQSDGVFQSSLLIHVIADEPLRVSGRFGVNMSMVLPQGTPFGNFTYSASGNLSTCGVVLGTQKDAETLAAAFPLLTEEIVHEKTTQARQMLSSRKADRAQNPHLYPGFSELAPRPGFYSPTHSIEVNTRDDFSAKPLFYIGASQMELAGVLADLPGKFSKKIFLVHPALKGIYCSGDLRLNRGFEISTAGDFFMLGVINLPDYGLLFSLPHSNGFFGSIVGYGITINAGSLYQGGAGYHARPDFISRESWDAFVDFKRRYFSEGV